MEDGVEFIKNLNSEMEKGFAEVDNAVACRGRSYLKAYEESWA